LKLKNLYPKRNQAELLESLENEYPLPFETEANTSIENSSDTLSYNYFDHLRESLNM